MVEDPPVLTNGVQQNQCESDEKFLLQFDSLIDSDIRELYNRYKSKVNVGNGNENEDFLPNYRLEDSIPTEILIQELNGSQSTLNSTVSCCYRKKNYRRIVQNTLSVFVVNGANK